MNKIFKTIQACPLFDWINFSDFSEMLICIDTKTKQYQKNQVILLSGNRIDFVGIVARGSVKILREDFGGNQTILTEVFPNDLFGEVFACAGILHSPVTIIASEDCEIVFLDYRKTVTTCCKSCTFHSLLIENMLKVIAKKNLMLNQKIDILSKRTLREKILCFLEYQRKGATQFAIHFNREELASYICADRSAVSAQLSKMQKDGLIRFAKNIFEIL